MIFVAASDVKLKQLCVLFGILAGLGVAIPFLTTIGFGFIDYDDGLHLFGNIRMAENPGTAIAAYWSAPFKGLYIPVTYTFWSLLVPFARTGNGILGTASLNPAVFHAVNVIIHSLNAMLVYFLLTRITKKYQPETSPPPDSSVRSLLPPLFGALLFGLHPMQVESVSWISEMRGLLSASLLLTALLATIGIDKKAMHDRQQILPVISGTILFTLAMLSKPSAVVSPILLLIFSVATTGRAKNAALLSGIWCLLIIPIYMITSGEQQANDMWTSPWILRPLLVLDTIGFYTKQLFVPIGLCIDYGRTPVSVLLHQKFTQEMALGGAILAISGLLFARGNRSVPTGSAIVIAGILPVSGIVPFIFQKVSTVGDRYFYVAMIGAAYLFAAALSRLSTIRMAVVSTPVIITCVLLSLSQMSHWKDSLSLFRYTAQINPNSTIALMGGGALLLDAGHPVEAARLLTHLLSVDPRNARGLFALGKCHLATGSWDNARSAFSLFVNLAPADAEGRVYFAQALSRCGERDSALQQIAMAHERGDSTWTCALEIAHVYSSLSMSDSAEKWFSAAIEREPRTWHVYNERGRFFLAANRLNDADADFSKALSIDPTAIPPRINRVRMLTASGSFDNARSDLQIIRNIEPHNPFPDSITAAIRH